jgi:hypothetical protein
MIFQGALYEAEDVFTRVDDVDVIELEARPSLFWREKWQRRLLWRDRSRRLIDVNPGVKPVRLQRDYDLFVLVCQNWWDLLYLPAIQGWQDRCRTSICYIDELWAAYISRFQYWIHILERFDHVIVGLEGSVGPLSRAIGRNCHFVPGGVDLLRFSPLPSSPKRVVNVFSIGRKHPRVHAELLRLSANEPCFYLYDTIQGVANAPVDHREHRSLIANTAKRSRFFMVGPAKMDTSEDTEGQVELGYRYFEGAAAGTVMIGQAPACSSFGGLFGWPDAVVEIQPDGSDVRQVLSDLESDPERLSLIGTRNAREALLRHDWAYRWREMLQLAGLETKPAMAAREARLRELAAMAWPV